MPNSKSQAIALQRRNQDIIQQALEGRPTSEIADDYALSEVRVRQILEQAMQESMIHMREDAGQLLAKNYARAEVLLINLMEMALAENDTGKIVLPAVDRIIKLMESQARLLGVGNLLVNPRDSGRGKYDSEVEALKPEEYNEIFEMATKDPNLEFIEDDDEQNS